MADLRTERTCNSLKEAFLTLLEHNRFESITVLQLCQCANIRRATFYSHFADKYEFMSFFIHEMRDEFISQIEEENVSCYDRLFHEMIAFLEARPQLVKNLKNSQLLPTMMEIFTDEVQQTVQRFLKENQPDTDETMIKMKSCFYAGGIFQLILLWMENPSQFKVDEINWLEFLV